MMTLVAESFFAASVIARRRRGRLEFLVMDTERLSGRNAGITLTQFPGGMSESVDQGNPERTLRAELEEETGLRIKPDAMPEILHYEVSGDHVKFFFLVWRSSCRGRIRTQQIQDRRSKLGRPYWATIEELRDGKKRLCESHRGVIPKLELLSLRPLAR